MATTYFYMLPLYFQECFIIFVELTRHAVSAYTINFTQEVAVQRVLFFGSTANIRFLQRLPLSFTFHPTELRMNPKRTLLALQKAINRALKGHLSQSKRRPFARALIISYLRVIGMRAVNTFRNGGCNGASAPSPRPVRTELRPLGAAALGSCPTLSSHKSDTPYFTLFR